MFACQTHCPWFRFIGWDQWSQIAPAQPGGAIPSGMPTHHHVIMTANAAAFWWNGQHSQLLLVQEGRRKPKPTTASVGFFNISIVIKRSNLVFSLVYCKAGAWCSICSRSTPTSLPVGLRNSITIQIAEMCAECTSGTFLWTHVKTLPCTGTVTEVQIFKDSEQI